MDVITLKIYRASIQSILFVLSFGVVFLLISVLSLMEEFDLLGIISIFFSLWLLKYALTLWKTRANDIGSYWDDEGIVVDLHGNKVYWYEIKDITYQNFQGSKSTLISTYYTHHENIRIRHKRWLPTIAHSIYWFSIEKPKDYHKNLMIAWEEKQTNKNKRLL
ncbi:hypothetical protein WB980_000694 [Bacillus cereus]